MLKYYIERRFSHLINLPASNRFEGLRPNLGSNNNQGYKLKILPRWSIVE